MIDLIDENFSLHAYKVPKLSGMSVFQDNDIIAVDSGLSCDTFNLLHITNPTINQDKLIKRIAYFRGRNLDYCIWLNQETLSPSVRDVFDQLKLTCQNEEVGMVLDLAQYNEIKNDQHNLISQVMNEEDLSAYANVIAANWNPPDENVIHFYEQTKLHYLNEENRIILLIYHYEGKPVSTVEMFPTDNETIGLYGFATLEAYRGKGIGSALMTYCLNLAKKLNYKNAILQGTADGLGIYKRYGFQPYTTYYEYA